MNSTAKATSGSALSAWLRLATSILVVVLGSLLAGCGGSGSSSPMSQTQQLPQLAGAWHVSASHSSNGVPTGVTYIDFNLNQTGSTITASQVAMMNITFNGSPGDYTDATWSSQNCAPGPYSLTGTVSAPNAVSFTVKQTGGEITGSATEGTGPQAGVLNGTYNDPQCNETNVAFVGSQARSLSGTYANTCNFNPCGTADPSLTLQISQDSSYNLTIAGSDTKDGSFTLTGTSIGSSMRVSGVISGQSVSYYGWHYAAVDKNLQEIFIIDADTNAPVATVEGCITGQNCTLGPL